jgi:hypothetical protein
MTTLGLKCSLEDLMDQQPDMRDKEIISLEIVTHRRRKYLVITYEDNYITTIKLYEDDPG